MESALPGCCGLNDLLCRMELGHQQARGCRRYQLDLLQPYHHDPLRMVVAP